MTETTEPTTVTATATDRETILCDFCSADYTDSTERGGFLFGSMTLCPKCVDLNLESITKNREDHYIYERCGPEETFRDFVRRVRAPGPEVVPIKESPKPDVSGSSGT